MLLTAVEFRVLERLRNRHLNPPIIPIPSNLQPDVNSLLEKGLA